MDTRANEIRSLRSTYYRLERENGDLRRQLGRAKGQIVFLRKHIVRLSNSDEWLTVGQYCTHYHISNDTLRRLELAGAITVRRVSPKKGKRCFVRVKNQPPVKESHGNEESR